MIAANYQEEQEVEGRIHFRNRNNLTLQFYDVLAHKRIPYYDIGVCRGAEQVLILQRVENTLDRSSMSS